MQPPSCCPTLGIQRVTLLALVFQKVNYIFVRVFSHPISRGRNYSPQPGKGLDACLSSHPALVYVNFSVQTPVYLLNS